MTAVQTKLTTREAIAKVLAGKSKPMPIQAIFEAAMPLTNLKGKFPKQTFYSVLYGENKKADGLVMKVGEGANFKLNPKRKADAPKAAAKRTPAKPKVPKGLTAVLELSPVDEAA